MSSTPDDDARTPLPRQFAEEILHDYSDVLRVGQARVNAEVVQWSTEGSTELQLSNFVAAFMARLHAVLPQQRGKDSFVHEAIYGFCKAVSINYVVAEVLDFLQRKTTMLCSIETRGGSGGGGLKYFVDISPDCRIQAGLEWTNSNNIIMFKPGEAKRTPVGTLSNLSTEFRLPLTKAFSPMYTLQMSERRSLGQRLALRFMCGGRSCCETGLECLMINEPLCPAHLCVDAGAAAVHVEIPLASPVMSPVADDDIRLSLPARRLEGGSWSAPTKCEARKSWFQRLRKRTRRSATADLEGYSALR